MKRIFVTVDTECHDIEWQDRYIWGKTRTGELWGIDKILSLGKELQIPINFFVDLPEAKKYGDAFTQGIIDKIHSAGQRAYIHLHPNYITEENEQTFFWKYNGEEKKAILKETKGIAERFLTEKERLVFRIGRYGADPEMYDAICEIFGAGVIDMSYCFDCWKMCHIRESDVHTKNNVTKFKSSILFPNTRYVGLKIGRKKKIFNIDASETCLGEFKSVLDRNHLDNITLTMHSWNFIKVFFFNKRSVWGDCTAERKFRKMVRYAQSKGYVFSDIIDSKDCLIPSEADQVIDLCHTPIGQLKALYYNFVRFQHMARLSKKYFALFCFFYLFSVVLFVLLLIVLL